MESSDLGGPTMMLKRVGALAGLTLTATFSGLVREAVIAFSLGTSATADAIAVGIFLVDLVNTLFLTGGVGFAFVPVIKRVRLTRGEGSARTLMIALVARIAAAAALLVGAVLFLLPSLVHFLGHGLTASQSGQVTTVLRGAIGSVAIMAVASALGAALYGFENFIAAACARLGWNAAIVLSLLALGQLSVALRASTALVSASVVAVAITSVALRRLGPVSPAWTHTEMRDVMTGAAPGILAVMTGNLLLGFWERSLLAHLGEGSIAMVNYAQRTSYMASTVSLAVHTVAFNEIVSALQTRGGAGAAEVVDRVLRRTLLFLGPLIALMVTARQPIIALVYGRGAFSANSVHVTADIFGLYAVDVMGVFVLGILLRVIYATERAWSASAPTVVMAVCAAIADWLLVGRVGVYAIPIGYGVGVFAAIVTALVQVRVHVGVPLWAPVTRSVLVSSGLAIAGGVAVLIVQHWTPKDYAFWTQLSGRGIQHSLILGVSIVAETVMVGVVALICARMCRMPELSELWAMLRHRRAAAEQAAT